MRKPATAILAGLTLAVASVGTGAAAGRFLITSANQIKPSVRAQLGIDWAQTYRVTEASAINGPQPVFVRATCRAGDHVLTGGTSADGAQVLQSIPVDQGWQGEATALANGGTYGSLAVVAVCVAR